MPTRKMMYDYLGAIFSAQQILLTIKKSAMQLRRRGLLQAQGDAGHPG
jgi:hypothetical protein